MMNTVKSLLIWDNENEKQEAETENKVTIQSDTVLDQQPKHSEENIEKMSAPSELDGDKSDSKSQFDYSELDRQMEEDLNAVVNSAKEWGSYLFNVGKRATVMAANQVNEAAKFIKEQVEESGNIEQKHSLLTGYSPDDPHTPPNTPIVTKELPQWLSFLTPNFCYFNGDKQRTAVLQLSTDKANFLTEPEGIVNYPDLTPDQTYSGAIAALKFDERLKEMRFSLVPRKVKEDKFWRNYFQRVWLISKCNPSEDDISSFVTETTKRLQVTDEVVNENESGERLESNQSDHHLDHQPQEGKDLSPQLDILNSPPIPSSDNVSLDDFEIVAKEDVIEDVDASVSESPISQ